MNESIMEMIGARTEDERQLVKAILGPLRGKPIDPVLLMTTCIMCANFISYSVYRDNPETAKTKFVAFLRESADSIEREEKTVQ